MCLRQRERERKERERERGKRERERERERESALKCESDYLAGIEVFCARARRHIGLTSELCHRLLLFHDHRQKSEKKTFSLVSYFSIFLSSTFGLSVFLFYCALNIHTVC